MIIRSLSATDFMRFPEFRLDDIPPRGLIGIFGDNECGKSTIGELMCFCLFGRTTRSPKGEAEHIIRWGAETCEAEMAFFAGDAEYKISRRLDKDGNAEATLTKVSDGTVIAGDPEKAEAETASLLGYGFREFRYSTYIAQKELDIILHSATDRRRVLNNMLGVGTMEKAAARVAERRHALEKAVDSRRRRIDDKHDVLDVYKAREEDLLSLDDELDTQNRDLLSLLKQRDQAISTMSLLEDIKRKREQYDVFDLRIKNRREHLKKIETEAADLMRETERIPKLLSENREKEAAIDEITKTQLAELDDKLRRIDEYRELIRRRDDQIKVLELKENALARLTDRLEMFAQKEDLLKRASQEQAAIDFFIESFSGENRYRSMASHLKNDIETLEVEFERARGEIRRELDAARENEHLCALHLERMRKQMSAGATEATVSPDQISIAKSKETAATRNRDISIAAGAAAVLAGVGLALGLGNLPLLFIAAPALPAWGFSAAMQAKMKKLREEREALQQKFYAFTVTQRGLLEFEDSIEETQSRHDAAKRLIARLEARLRDTEDLQCNNFGDLEKSLAEIKKSDSRDLDRARGIIDEILAGYANLRNLVGFESPFKELESFEPATLLTNSRSRKIELEEQIRELTKELEDKGKFVEQSESYIKEIRGERDKLAGLDRAITDLGITAGEEPAVRAEIQDIDANIEQLKREMENNEKEVERIRAAGEDAAVLEKKRKQIINEIDTDLIQFYELREATRDIDCSDEKFVELRRQLDRVESGIADARRIISDRDGQRKIIKKDLERATKVEIEMKSIEDEIAEMQDTMLKCRELETLFIGAGLDIKKRVIPQIESYFSWILPRMTRGRYHQVQLSDDFGISIYSEEKGGYVDLDTLSGGTMDQLLISLRLAFARAATANAAHPNQFLFLDEPISSFDESRRELFFLLLKNLKEGFRQIFLISHLPNLEEFTDNYIHVTLAASEQPTVVSWK